ncbi:hypothetical protein HMPREF1219_01102 [Corynebacterium pyruviciproducens ATCC BAA-1742]|uniref:Fatty acid ABC transporter ATP-binding/permease protein n=1 Tax=Corynebacterium pyruviciproducens ATCC BAA-1742 TaxID=1125779 RepID=S2Z6D1_9CORY|nr:ABC transporter ATP-binding protein [Corynebacterium pyruviciproducens]EPD69770.1 hypothetical protein HMPREF1219_01102 [Corynebacterium pyruviciproducens ATCC BAA-1742]
MKSVIGIIRNVTALWPFYVGVIIASLVTAALNLVNPFIMRDATDTIVSVVSGNQALAQANTRIIWLTVAILAVGLLNTAVRNIGGYIGDVMAARMRQILSTRYYAQLLSLPQRYFDTQVTGTIIARLDRSIASITQFLQAFSNNFFPMLLTVAAVLVITAVYYWPLTVLLAIIFPIYMWLTALTSKKWQRLEGAKNKQIDLAGGRFAEVIGQVKVVKSFVTEVAELVGFSKRYGKTVSLTREQSRYWHVMDIARGAAMDLIFLFIYGVLFYRTLHGFFSLGDMVMLIQLVTMARQPVMMMSYLVDTTQRAVAGSKDYFEVMNVAPEPTANEVVVEATSSSHTLPEQAQDAHTLPAVGSTTIDFDDVSFGYDEGDEVIHNVSFTVHPGEKVALVGESGGGKSTLVNLILGLYRPTEGALTINGHDVTAVQAEDLRKSVGVVFQDSSLFSGTVRENIAYGKPDATDEEVVSAAKAAFAHDFIEEFPDGYDTVIGERGLRLSGGQKQRVAIARAMLKDAPILVLDEATSALDTKAEQQVQAGLEALMHNRSTLIIAHRLSTIASVDMIVTLDKGHVDEIGAPAELAASGGIYAQLLALTSAATEESRQRLKEFGLIN